MEVIIAVFILVACLLLGVAVPFSFLASVVFLIVTRGYDPSFLLPYGYAQMNSIVIMAVPLFILAGNIMNEGKIGDKLINFVNLFAGRLKGGLGVVTCVSCAVFGSITGSAFATLSCIGSLMAPRLKAGGYPVGYAGALLASSCLLGLLIPPSPIMILYAFVGRQSVLACFLAIIAPGLLLMILLSVVNVVYVRSKNILVEEKIPWREMPRNIAVTGGKAIPAFFFPFIILGGVYGGFMTPTEAAAVGAIYAIPLGFFIYKGLNAKSFYNAVIKSAVTSGTCMVMLFTVMLFSRIYITENVPARVMELLMDVSTNPLVVILMLNLFMVIVGMIMDDVSAVMLCTAVLMPLVNQMGFNPIHFAAIVAVNLGMGCVTPPTAPCIFIAGRITGARVDQMVKPTLIFILFAWLPTLFITTYFPRFSLFLPNLWMRR